MAATGAASGGEARPWQDASAAQGEIGSPPAGLYVGISGAPDSTPRSGSQHAVVRCRELGLDALEMAWVHSVSMGREGAERVRAAASEHGVRLSVHAPYAINLNSPDETVVDASQGRIRAAARAASWCGARDVVVHLASRHGDLPEVVLDRVTRRLETVVEQLAAEGVDVTLRAEIMGRHSQFGDLEEILLLCRRLAGVGPCIDIAHLHARTGAWNSKEEFVGLWEAVGAALGSSAHRDAHVHLSGIEYGAGGERRHLTLEEADLDYVGFLQVMADLGIEGLVIAESPGRERDATLLSETWRRLHGLDPATRASG